MKQSMISAILVFLIPSILLSADQSLPRVLIIGDSISLGYTPFVIEALEGRAIVEHNRSPNNAGDTVIGMKNIDDWLGDTQWDVIHFNWGLWDICHRMEGKRDLAGPITATPAEYEERLTKLVERLTKTGANLIWAPTTYVQGGWGRVKGDEIKYNAIAARIMKKHGVRIDDIHALTATFPPELFKSVGNVHFSDAGYQRIAEQVATSIAETLAGKTQKVETRYAELVRTMLDTLIEKGRDRYGKEQSPLFAANLSVDTLECLLEPKLYYTTGPRILGGRVKRRSPGGSNLYFDQATFKAMEWMSALTGDPKYSTAVADALRFQLRRAVDSKGLPTLGGHTYWDFYTEAIDMNKHESHEFWYWPMAWDLWFQADPAEARDYVDLIWQWHVVDDETGETNRHSDKKSGMAFTFMVGNFIAGWAQAAEETGHAKYKEYCEKVAEYHWAQRNSKTNLIPATGTPGKRGDQNNCTTMIPAFAHRLITSGRQIGSDKMVTIGRALLDAYARYGYDSEAGLFHCSLTLEGEPVKPQVPRRLITGQENLPARYVATWMPYVGYHDLPLETAQVYAWAAESVDKTYLETAQRWAQVIEKSWEKRYGGFESWLKYKEALDSDPEVLKAYKEKDYPYTAPHGLFADHYGRVIQFALTMHRLTGQKKWQEFARTVADTACAELWKGHIFVGHIEKADLYENSDNVGILLLALLELQDSLSPGPRHTVMRPFF